MRDSEPTRHRLIIALEKAKLDAVSFGDGERISVESVACIAGVSKACISECYPDILNWICQEAKSFDAATAASTDTSDLADLRARIQVLRQQNSQLLGELAFSRVVICSLEKTVDAGI